MGKFLLIRRQDGQGCDYSIGCGVTAEELKASTINDAIAEVLKFPPNWKELESDDLDELFSDIDREDPVVSIQLIEVGREVDLMEILLARKEEIKDLKRKRKIEEEEKYERAQYEKLKKKFEKKDA